MMLAVVIGSAVALELALLIEEARRRESKRRHPAWTCTRDHQTTPCGDCDGCRWNDLADSI